MGVGHRAELLGEGGGDRPVPAGHPGRRSLLHPDLVEVVPGVHVDVVGRRGLQQLRQGDGVGPQPVQDRRPLCAGEAGQLDDQVVDPVLLDPLYDLATRVAVVVRLAHADRLEGQHQLRHIDALRGHERSPCWPPTASAYRISPLSAASSLAPAANRQVGSRRPGRSGARSPSRISMSRGAGRVPSRAISSVSGGGFG